MIWNADSLDEFVAAVDRAGGPGTAACDALWREYSYELATIVDQSLDPFGDAYSAQQAAVYEELSGHRYHGADDEFTEFDVARHVAAANPYAHPDPAALATHLQRLTRALRYAAPRFGETLIDMGCGWGLSSEIAAYLGLTVHAVDINPKFVELVNSRAQKGSRAISATLSAFDDYVLDGQADIALFYECFHHAVRPWETLRKVAGNLRPGGRVVFAGEPINALWWKNWGMRLDPMSVYCIRKFGWFESGWSMDFLTEIIRNAGMTVEVYSSDDPDLGAVVVAKKRPFAVISGAELVGRGMMEGADIDGSFVALSGAKTIQLKLPVGLSAVHLDVTNHRQSPLRARFDVNGSTLYVGDLSVGDTTLQIVDPGMIISLTFEIEAWVPNDEIGNGDRRSIGAHLRQATFVTA